MKITDDLHDLPCILSRNVDHTLGQSVDGRHNDAVDGESRIAHDVFKRRADVIDVEMRDYPIEMQHLDPRRLAQRKQMLKAVRAVFSAIMEHKMPIQRKNEAIRLLNFGMPDGIYA